MMGVRIPRYFKFIFFACLIVICLISLSRHRISQLARFGDDDGQKVKNIDVFKSEDENGESEQEAQFASGEDDHAEDEIEIFNDDMPGAYLKFNEPAPTNQSYCKYNYEFPYDLRYNKSTYLFGPELDKNSPYRAIYNITQAHSIGNVAQVTYATHMTANFAYFIPQLLQHWDGLISVSAFVPDLDVAFFLEQIHHYCYCEPEMYRVSVHIVTHKYLAFSKKDIYFDRPENCMIQDSSKVPVFTQYDDTVIYPINVLRNVARVAAVTKYVMMSDCELMPSQGLASGFLKMIEKYNKTNPKEVFVLPIFEVEETESIPDNKEELLSLYEVQKAVYFHALICNHCQKFPEIERWLETRDLDEIKPFTTVKRHDPYNRWEPIFIGTNADPLYSESLSWEGFQDKMTQSLEMCLLDYDYTILDNAFLCHWPGIKKIKVQDEEWRARFVEQNQLAYQDIIANLLKKYKDIPECKVNYTGANLSKNMDKKDGKAIMKEAKG